MPGNNEKGEERLDTHPDPGEYCHICSGVERWTAAEQAGYEKGEEMRAPVQSTASVSGGRSLPGGTIAWWEHEQAWKGYAVESPGAAAAQDAKRIADRGGFGRGELLRFLGHEPLTFEPKGTLR